MQQVKEKINSLDFLNVNTVKFTLLILCIAITRCILDYNYNVVN